MNMEQISLELAEEFLDKKEQESKYIAGAVALCILSPTVLIFLAGMTDSMAWNITEGFAVAVGLTILLMFVAVASAIFTFYGITSKKYEEWKTINLSDDIILMTKKRKMEFEKTFASKMAAGVVFCILAVVPLIIAGVMDAPDYICCALVSDLLIMVAVGTYMIVEVNIINESYKIFLEQDEFIKIKEKERIKSRSVSKIYWHIIIATYLAISFLFRQWEISWILWPLAGILYPALMTIVEDVNCR